MPDPDQVVELQARADAGDRNAPGRLGELLAARGDLEDAVRVWAQAYGDGSPTTRRIAELLAERGDLEGAVRAWQFSDAVWQNPECSHAKFLSTLTPEDYRECDDEPEEWSFIEGEELARLLAERRDEEAIAELRAKAAAGDPAAAKQLAELPIAQDLAKMRPSPEIS